MNGDKAGDYRWLWCPRCMYTVTFTEAEWETYGSDWYGVLEAACQHDCRLPDVTPWAAVCQVVGC